MKTIIIVIILSLSFTCYSQDYQRSAEEIKEDLRHDKCKVQYLNKEYDQVISYYDSIKPVKNYLRFEMYKMASESYLNLAEIDSVQSDDLKTKSEQAYNEALRWYGSMRIQDWDSLKIEIYDTPEKFEIVDEQPSPKGGMAKFYGYVGKEMKYPKEARKKRIEGRVFVQFVVNKDGSLDAVNVLEGIGGGCDEEAVRIIQNADNWNPGKQKGRPVYVRMILPITFRL